MARRLVPMDGEEYASFRARSLREFTESRALAMGVSFEEALPSAEEQFVSLLPDGQATKAHYFLVLKDGDVSCGHLWFGIRTDHGQQKTFIYDIRVLDDARGLGHGTFMLDWLVLRTRALGLCEVALHVFGHNVGARRLYERLGFETTSLWMTKRV